MQPTRAQSLGAVRCREILESDADRIADLLARGFRARGRSFWRSAIQRLSEREALPKVPRLGYMLESGSRAVGVLLLISAAIPDSARTIRCNVSSWYVEPEFRLYAPLLVNHALRCPEFIYTNVTADPHTWPILLAQGYRRYSEGLFLSIPLLSRAHDHAEIVSVRPESPNVGALRDYKLLAEHASYGCISVACLTESNSYPFVFRPRLMKKCIPYAQLIYCLDLQYVVRFAKPLGRHLLRYGLPLLAIDATGPVSGMNGLYLRDVNPRYCKGESTPRLGDLAYSEIAMFGV